MRLERPRSNGRGVLATNASGDRTSGGRWDCTWNSTAAGGRRGSDRSDGPCRTMLRGTAASDTRCCRRSRPAPGSLPPLEYCQTPCRNHHRRMVSQANSPVSAPSASSTKPSLAPTSYTPYGMTLPDEALGKSWSNARTSPSVQPRPERKKSPNNSFFFVSMLITGHPRARYCFFSWAMRRTGRRGRWTHRERLF